MILEIDTSILDRIPNISINQLVFLTLVLNDIKTINQDIQRLLSLVNEEEIQELIQRNIVVVNISDNNQIYSPSKELLDFIKKNIQYPEIARKNGIQGRVIVGVVVDKNGSVTNLTILKSIDPYLDKEAIRVIRLMPKWKPGTQMDKPVKVKYAIPVSFKLAD